MNRLTAIIVFILMASLANAQAPVRWDYSVKKTGDKQYEIKLTAHIAAPWHIYSQHNPDDGIAYPTKISFLNNPLLVLVGQPKESGKLITENEEILDLDLKYFAEKVEFVQTVKVKANAKTNAGGSIAFMACTNERCLLPEKVNFSVALN